MTSTLRDLEDGTTVCTACGREVVDGHSCQDTQNPLLAEGNGSSALPGMAADRVAEDSVDDPVKAMLPPGAFRTADHRYYWNGQGPNPSVTTVLNDVLLKHGLDY